MFWNSNTPWFNHEFGATQTIYLLNYKTRVAQITKVACSVYTGDGVAHINKVKPRRARLVLGLATVDHII